MRERMRERPLFRFNGKPPEAGEDYVPPPGLMRTQFETAWETQTLFFLLMEMGTDGQAVRAEHAEAIEKLSERLAAVGVEIVAPRWFAALLHPAIVAGQPQNPAAR